MKNIRLAALAWCLIIGFPLSVGADHVLEGEQYGHEWRSLKLEGLNLHRLAVPGGWLVREGLGKFFGFATDTQTRVMVFVPDYEHSWLSKESKKGKWRTLKMDGLNLYRLRTPYGWLVREGIGKLGADNQTRMMLHLEDPTHSWRVKPK
ncbi:MAG: hypothetical protein ACI8P9_001778 [Parasphingorhabdus sp.]|jgi:hypothetical protein